MTIPKAILLKWLSIITVALSISICLLPAIVRIFVELESRLSEFYWTPLAIAFGLALIHRPASALGWRMILRAFGYQLPRATAVRIWLTAESCRWLPGGIWHFSSRGIQSNSHGIPIPIAVASMAMELFLTVAGSLGIAVAAMIVYGSQLTGVEHILSAREFFVFAMVGLGATALGALTYLPLRYLFPHKYLILRDRLASLRNVHPRILPTFGCLIFYSLLVILNGLAFYATVKTVSPNMHVPLFASIAANAVAWVAGLIAIMAPGGLGVREAVLVLQMSVWMRVSDAVLVAVLWRVLLLVVELLCVIVASASLLIARGFARYCRPVN